MERTINGRPIKEVLEKLKEDIPGVIKMTTEKESNPYLDSTVLKNYFEKHVPVSNYDFNLGETQFVQLNGRACFICTGTIILYDDNGRKIVEKSYIGSNNVIIGKQSGAPIDFAMDAKNAAVSAKKGCIIQFGCGVKQLDLAKAQNKELKKKRAKENADIANQNFQEGVQYGVSSEERPKTGRTNFLLAYNSKKQIKNFPKMILVPVYCREFRNYETTLLIWKSSCKDATAVYNRIATGTEFTCDGKFEAYNNEYRIVFEGLRGKKP